MTDVPGVAVADINAPGQATQPTRSSLEIPELRADFMKILVEQMRQQDPFSSAENSGEFLSQMAEFSNLEQTQNLNTSILAMLSLQSQNAAIQDLSAGSALIGQEVIYVDADGSEQTGLVESVSISSNGTYLQVNGEDVPLLAISKVLGKPESEEESGGN